MNRLPDAAVVQAPTFDPARFVLPDLAKVLVAVEGTGGSTCKVYAYEKIDGVWEQRLRIHYNCVGVVEIPELIPLPAPEVSVNTRKGVVVNYAPSTIAG